MFRVGQKLVCLVNERDDYAPFTIEKNAIYTYDGYEEHGWIYLFEFNLLAPNGLRWSFPSEFFRPVDETFGKEVCEKVESEFLTVEV